jgi:Na+-transporting NADH:ubiquinone oxidoreductase subunit C
VNNESPLKALLVVVLVALVTSSFVSAAVVLLRPIQMNNLLLNQSKNIMQLTSLLPQDVVLPDAEILTLFKSLDQRIVDLSNGKFVPQSTPQTRSNERMPDGFATVYLVWQENQFKRVILPVSGEGMWSTLYGYIALESDLNTIADAIFYEQNETPGLGDQITRPDWLAQWRGRRLYNDNGDVQFAVAGHKVDPDSSTAMYEVDALTGATVTADAVTSLVRDSFGPDGFQSLLVYMTEQLRQQTLIDSSPPEAF